jgi:flavodoxin
MATYKKNLKKIRKELGEDEKEITHIKGTYNPDSATEHKNAIMMATDKRVIFYGKRAAGYDFESYNYNQITSITDSKKLMGHIVTIFATGNTISLEWVKKESVREFVQYVKDHAGVQEISDQKNDDIPSQIEKLSSLKDSGAISEEEYEKKKAELLKRM